MPGGIITREGVIYPVPGDPGYLADTAITRIELDGAIKVGLLLPLSGRHARLGEALLNAAQLALFDVADQRFTLVVRDTRGTPEGAAAATRAVLAEGSRLILGPLFASSVQAMAETARGLGVSVIAFSNDRTVAGGGVLIMGLAPGLQIARLISYASRQGLTRFAVLAPETPYGKAVVDAMQDAVFQNRAELVRLAFYDPEAADLSNEVRFLADYEARQAELLEQRELLAARSDEASKLALERLETLDTFSAPDFEAVVLPEGGKRLLSVAPLLAYFDVDPREVRFLGTAAWEDPELGREPTLRGGWFTAPSPELWSSFRTRYQTTFGTEPPRLASLAYDATALAAVLARRAIEADRVPDFGQSVLTQPAGFS
ncbi:MAG: penicillin-binding protein activator, partial [Kiloniellales bacterium]